LCLNIFISQANILRLELVGVASCCHHFAVLVKQQNAIVASYFLATARTGATSFSFDSYAL
jgi:hypothetical protein